MRSTRSSLKVAILALIAMLCVAPQARSQDILWGAVFNNIRLSDQSTLNPVGNTILLGHFANGTDFNSTFTFAGLMAAFTTYQSSVMGFDSVTGMNDLGPGAFTADTGFGLPGVAGEQVYFWVFNSATPSLATQWAIVTNPLWLRPADGANVATFNIGDPGNIVVGPFGNIINSGPFTGDLALGVIPEPSTYLLGVVGGGAMLGLLRRRRRTAAV